jgi:GNAT superfamily N-acetyltransferase
MESRWTVVVGRWLFEEWGSTDPDGSAESWARGMERRVGRVELPIQLVAVDDDEPVGTAAIIVNDIPPNDPNWATAFGHWGDVTPWMSTVFVPPNQRRRGIGSMLVEAIVQLADEHGASQLFLQTSTAQSLYERLGFEVIGRERHQEEDVVVMRRKLGVLADA